MRGCEIILGNISFHTGNTYGLVQEVKTIEPPTIQSYKVQVPGRNGLLNLTKALTGRVVYDNRNITLQYFAYGTRAKLLEIRDLFCTLHGETIDIIDDDTIDFYYRGECTVSTTFKLNYLQIVLNIDAEPFRVAQQYTTRYISLTTTTKSVVIMYDGVAVAPTFSCTGSVTITQGSKTKTISKATTWEDTDFIIEHGTNTLEVSGSGTLTIKYKEAFI